METKNRSRIIFTESLQEASVSEQDSDKTVKERAKQATAEAHRLYTQPGKLVRNPHAVLEKAIKDNKPDDHVAVLIQEVMMMIYSQHNYEPDLFSFINLANTYISNRIDIDDEIPATTKAELRVLVKKVIPLFFGFTSD